MLTRFVASCLTVLCLVACTFNDPPSPDRRTAFQTATASDGEDCAEYLFDSALANLEYSTPVLVRARRVLPYAPADTNMFGWTQMRYVVQLESPYEVDRPYDIIYFHGGGGDVGHAAYGDNLVYEFLENGYNVLCVEYRRGWHEGSYDPCVPRNVFNATEADFMRLDSAAAWAVRDVRLALGKIAANTTDSFILYGASFGAHLAMMSGPFDDPVRVERNRIKGCMALYGCIRPGLTMQSPMPTFLLHGADDSLNVPDRGPIFATPPPVGRIMDGSRMIYARVHENMPTWLLMHNRGHGTGPINSSGLRTAVEDALIKGRIPTGRYRLTPFGGIVPETPSGEG